MAKQLTIRTATPDDLSACLALDHSLETLLVWQMQQTAPPPNFTVSFRELRLPRPIRVEYPRPPATLHQELGSGQGVLVAEAEDVLLGYAHLVFNQADESAALRNLAVDPAVRQQGIGRALLSQAVAYARRRGANRLVAETTPRSYPAIRLFVSQQLAFCGYQDLHFPNRNIAIFLENRYDRNARHAPDANQRSVNHRHRHYGSVFAAV
ncbi:MAG: GNAT family N-acetyltransferase [Anaerolineae bacterium]|nr:GNAT family N-acetyltransferase [Anaerolineae bacterium]